MSVTPTEVRIEHSVADQRATARAFTVLYAVLALGGIVVSLFLAPELRLGAAFFAAYILVFTWRLRRRQAAAVPWVIALTPTELRHTHDGVAVQIAKAEAAEVRIDERAGPRMRVRVVEVRNHIGEVLLTVSLPGPSEATALDAAFEEWGWPLRS